MTAEPEIAGPYLYAPKDPLRILFVDADPILREFAVGNLAGPGAEIDTAASQAEAMSCAAAHRPDVVLISVEAPDYEALGLLEALRERPGCADIPVIAVTGREDIEGVDAAFAAGATAFVVKPLNWRLVARHVRFVHRATATAKAEPLGDDEATEQLLALAREGVRFIAQAMTINPALKPAAVPFAAAADVALETRTAGGAG